VKALALVLSLALPVSAAGAPLVPESGRQSARSFSIISPPVGIGVAAYAAFIAAGPVGLITGAICAGGMIFLANQRRPKEEKDYRRPMPQGPAPEPLLASGHELSDLGRR